MASTPDLTHPITPEASAQILLGKDAMRCFSAPSPSHCGAANTQQYGGAGVSHPTEERRLAPPLFTSPLSSLL
ncbi:hypothetical protein J6590_031415 [Homalodisca vitripennis]|nr:hypothetical protein J6590_031415 [Homalodisca vitripennis]